MRDLTTVKDALKNHQIELPSWAFGNSGTRFKVFSQPGVPRDPWEKAADAAQVHKYTGVAPVMAVHIPWDKVDDYAALSAHARDNGIRIGAVNSNVFQDDDYKLGSVCNPDPKVRSIVPSALSWSAVSRLVTSQRRRPLADPVHRVLRAAAPPAQR